MGGCGPRENWEIGTDLSFSCDVGCRCACSGPDRPGLHPRAGGLRIALQA